MKKLLKRNFELKKELNKMKKKEKKREARKKAKLEEEEVLWKVLYFCWYVYCGDETKTRPWLDDEYERLRLPSKGKLMDPEDRYKAERCRYLYEDYLKKQ